MRKARKPTIRQSPLDFDQKERKNRVEWDAVKATWRKARKWKLIIILFVIVGLVSPVISVRMVNIVTEMGQALGSKYRELNADKPGRQAALQAVNSWLTGDQSGFRAGISNLWWDDATKVGEKSDTSALSTGDGQTTEYWSHRMSFTDLTDGETRDVTQLVAVTGGIATAVGEPTILPQQVTTNTNQSFQPSGYQQVDQPQSFTNVAAAWAKAYAGKDSAAFTVLVGDPDASHMYQPASVGVMKNSGVNWMVACTKDGQPTDKKHKDQNPAWGCASITITFDPYPITVKSDGTSDPSQPSVSDDVNNSRSVKTSVTVLVKNPTLGSAKIVDWGADGSLSTLSPYANAVDKSLISSSGDSSDESDTGTDSTSGTTGDSATAPPASGTGGDTGSTSSDTGSTPSGEDATSIQGE